MNNSASLTAIVYEGNLFSALKYNKKTRKHSAITKDNLLKALGMGWASGIVGNFAYYEEDPDKYRETLEGALDWSQTSIFYCKIIKGILIGFTAYSSRAQHFITLSSIETNIEKRRNLLRKAVQACREFFKFSHGTMTLFDWFVQLTKAEALLSLSKTEKEITNKHRILEQVLETAKQVSLKIQQKLPLYYIRRARIQNLLAMVQFELVKIESKTDKKIKIIAESISHIENCISFMEKDSKQHSVGWKSGYYGKIYYSFAEILNQYYLETEDQKFLYRAVDFSSRTIETFIKSDQISRLAESCWQKAKLLDSLNDHLNAAKNYESAAKNYEEASKKITQLSKFYQDHSNYMLAWSEIEQAKYNHSRENYSKARTHYENAGKLHERLDDWNYLSSNYFAWAKIEQAEEYSRTEKPQKAIDNFHEAIEYFQKTEANIKTKNNENPTAEEEDLITRILEASGLRQRYCKARILMEEAKLLDREGNFLDSSKKYRESSQTISAIVEKVENDVEGKELEYVAILCRAWEKMAKAEEATSSEYYIEAATLFEEAKEHCFTKKASLWALGNSSFCKGLSAGIEYQSSADLREHSKAKSLLKSAANSYLQAGFNTASEYAKATQRLFDAYLSMNQAEMEADQEKRAKHYQMAESLLQIAAGSFLKAKQPEKQAQIQEILSNVREEKALAVSLSQVMQAPTIASSALSFAAPTPTSESSVGLETFEHANVQANLVTQVKEVKVGESFCLSIEFVNAGRESALLMRVEGFLSPDFVVVKKPEIYRIEDTILNMKGKQLAPLKLVEVKLTLQASKKGEYTFNPRVYYLDELGQNKSLQLKTVEIKVEEVIMEDRIITGTEELDSLLLGGIPKEYAVVLSGSPSDERELIVKNFLRAGTKEEVTFNIATETTGLESLLENPNFYLFLCNPKPKTNVPDLPNVYKLQGKTDITNLGIALTKAIRNIDQKVSRKRICIEILSDVLVKHGTNTTREWISSLITDLGVKGFTMLAVMYPEMHQSEESKAILSLFDGEISILQSDDPLDCKKSIHVKKLRNQDYIKNPICLR